VLISAIKELNASMFLVLLQLCEQLYTVASFRPCVLLSSAIIKRQQIFRHISYDADWEKLSVCGINAEFLGSRGMILSEMTCSCKPLDSRISGSLKRRRLHQ